MFTTSSIADPLMSRHRKVILDCRELDFHGASSIADSVIACVTSYPQPHAMNVYLPSATPALRTLQLRLLELGCSVFRVTK